MDSVTAKPAGRVKTVAPLISRFISVCPVALSTVLTIWKREPAFVNDIGPDLIALRVSEIAFIC